MGRVPNCGGDGGLGEWKSHVWEPQNGIVNGEKGEGQALGSSEEGVSRANEVAKDVDNGTRGVVELSNSQQIIQQQLQGPVIRWDRFLPIRTLKVLLVENDDSTRHVVSALLRNCSYEVTAVANGLQAWRILEDLTNHIDLILTEVVMPLISGIGLLYKIMNHKTFKNIPVIMMSSHDSMGIVFKCLSKGAVDFLVKPIRKNELKNLWQHVWRRCHSSSGSGSESGTQSRRSTRSKSIDQLKNNSSSSDEHENGSIGLSLHDGSDEGSGAQSSWTKKAFEVDSPQPTGHQLADAPDSTCAQVILTKSETISNRWHATEAKKCQQLDEQLDNTAMGKDLEIGSSRNPCVILDRQLEKFSKEPTNNSEYSLHETDCKPFEKQQMDNMKNVRDNMGNKVAEKASLTVNSTKQQMRSKTYEDTNGLSDVSLKDTIIPDSKLCPSLELSLESHRGARDVETNAHDDRNVLRHSDLSAFSKYTSGPSANQATCSKKQAPTGNVGSCSPLYSSSVAMMTETMHYYRSHSTSTPPNQQSNESTNKNDMVSTMRNVAPKLETLNDKSESTSAFNCFRSSLQDAKDDCPIQQEKPGKADDLTSIEVQVQSRNSRQVHVEHHHHHYHHYHHHVHDAKPHQPSKDHKDSPLKSRMTGAPQCGSSNVISGPIDGNTTNYSMNGSGSGSHYGSNGKNEITNALNTGTTNMGSDNAIAGNSKGCISGKISGYGSDEDRFAKREAALTKFRQKRKERCFEKKVRYQSRKKLAEQRPRIRGQFVRQIVHDAKTGQDTPIDDDISGDNSCDSVQ